MFDDVARNRLRLMSCCIVERDVEHEWIHCDMAIPYQVVVVESPQPRGSDDM